MLCLCPPSTPQFSPFDTNRALVALNLDAVCRHNVLDGTEALGPLTCMLCPLRHLAFEGVETGRGGGSFWHPAGPEWTGWLKRGWI